MMEKERFILIVDDNLTFVDRVISMLRESGNSANISVASNYDEACRLVSREEYRVVLLDINLPGKNGIELLKLIKKSKKNTDVIMITNHADAYYRHQCLELGAEYFLDKSDDFALLPEIICEIFGGPVIKK